MVRQVIYEGYDHLVCTDSYGSRYRKKTWRISLKHNEAERRTNVEEFYMKEGQKLPLFGVGPYIVYGMAMVNVIGIILLG